MDGGHHPLPRHIQNPNLLPLALLHLLHLTIVSLKNTSMHNTNSIIIIIIFAKKYEYLVLNIPERERERERDRDLDRDTDREPDLRKIC